MAEGVVFLWFIMTGGVNILRSQYSPLHRNINCALSLLWQMVMRHSLLIFISALFLADSLLWVPVQKSNRCAILSVLSKVHCIVLILRTAFSSNFFISKGTHGKKRGGGGRAHLKTGPSYAPG